MTKRRYLRSLLTLAIAGVFSVSLAACMSNTKASGTAKSNDKMSGSNTTMKATSKMSDNSSSSTMMTGGSTMSK